MARPNLDVDLLSSTERTRDKTKLGSAGPAQEACGSGQTQQFSGVLIKLFKVPVSSQTGFISPTFRGKGAEEVLRKPSICWICRRLLTCLSKSLDGRDTAFILGSSTSNCALNHELLIAIRIFLKQNLNGMSPDDITVESASLGALRLILTTKAPNAEWTIAAHSVQSGIQAAEMATWKPETAKDSQILYTIKSYDVYQDLQATTIGVPETWLPKAAPIPKNSNSRECLRLARSWLDDCLLDHPQCRMNEIPKLPRRVIDVEEKQLRLVVPHAGTRGYWVALSHCWGQTNTFKTTLKTLKSHMHGIEWEALPKTFKDAVLVTRTLEVRYLWIDSLCIVQDDGGTDFHSEAAKMCDIYRNSILTIAASCSASDCVGFLGERILDDPIELDKPPRLQAVRLRQAVDHSRMLRDDPIHSRAWTFQETILPRRLLSFGSQEATWECEAIRRCECRQIESQEEDGTTHNELGRAAYRKYTRAISQNAFRERHKYELHASLNKMPISEFYRYWRRVLVPEYTRRALSKDNDRLIALQAIASDIHSMITRQYLAGSIAIDIHLMINRQYLAGLWRADLINQLCWQSADGRGLPANNNSPSWSWSSIRGPVVPYLPEECEKERFDVEIMLIGDAICSLAGQNPCGKILNGAITLKTKAMAVRCIRNKETGLLEFYPGALRSDCPELKASVPLKLEFSPDTVLSCQPDGSMTRSAEGGFLNTRHHDRNMSAILLLVKEIENWNWCMLLCGRVSAGSNTCHRLGIGVLGSADVQSLYSYMFDGEFVLI